LVKRFKKGFQFLISLSIGGLFLWLAFHNVKWDSLWKYMEDMSYGWLVPFLCVSVFSHYLRTERWKLLVEKKDVHVDRSVLFSGVMIGYVINYAIPRLGEVSRCVYVGRREQLSASNLLGTVILERVIDLICLIALLVFVVFYIVTDPAILRQLFGQQTFDWFHNFFSIGNLIELILLGLSAVAIAFGIYRLLNWLSHHSEFIEKIHAKLTHFIKMLVDGLLGIRRIKNWPLFIGLTILMWFCYILMTYIPFYMFNMVSAYHLNIIDALTVTVLAAIGIAIPSPGGMGTYHWFVKQSLWVLYKVPQVTGLAYAFITYSVTLLMFLTATPIIILISRLLGAGKQKNVDFKKILSTPAEQKSK
jgi:uncharacterized protein (TIRG00374 family)